MPTMTKPPSPSAASVLRTLSILTPYPHERPLLMIPTVLLFIGSVFSLLHPSPTYFSYKRNIFNIFFVKILWFWTTVVFVVFLVLCPFFKSRPTSAGQRSPPRRLQALLRYFILTASWYLTTQWFFGPPLIDRSFVLTGGACAIPPPQAAIPNAETQPILTASLCRRHGGQWSGGHDISGHVFLLVVSSGFLGMEVLPVLRRWVALLPMPDSESDSNSGVSTPDESLAHSDVEEKNEKTASLASSVLRGTTPLFVVLMLDYWMLLMTAIYFHTWFEKITGLLLAASVLFTVYFLPRLSLQLKAIIGAPEQ